MSNELNIEVEAAAPLDAPVTVPAPAPKSAPLPSKVVEVPVAVEVVPAEEVPFIDTDKVGTVFPGDKDGRAALVVRLIGQGDGGDYSGAAVDRIKYLQEQAGLEPTGIVSGVTWGLVLRGLKVGSSGEEVIILCRLLAMPDATVFTSEHAELIENVQVRASLPVTGKMDPDTWAALLA